MAGTVQGLEFHLLPENVPVLLLWGDLQSCWAHGFSGPVGFRWTDVRSHPASRRIPRADREEVLEGIAVMERAWLGQRAEMAEQERQMKGH